jgi:hypothetical protein
VPSHPCAVLPPPHGQIQFALGGWEEEREAMGMGCVGGRCEICMGVRTLLDLHPQCISEPHYYKMFVVTDVNPFLVSVVESDIIYVIQKISDI